MAYCRFGADSDVYFYADASGVFICSACSLDTEVSHIKFPCHVCGGKGCDECTFSGPIYRTHQEALEHLKLHRDAGHRVPEAAIKRLEVETDKEKVRDFN